MNPAMDKDCRHRPSTEHGLVLVGALWLLILLTTITLSLARDSRLSLQSTGIYADELRANALVQGAAYEYIHSAIIGSSEAQLLERLGAQGIKIEIVHEREKLDLNAATLQQITNHLRDHEYSRAEELAAMVVDFRDKDNDSQLGGSEKTLFNKSARPPPKNAKFQHIYELSQIPGLQIASDSNLLDSVTIFGRSHSAPVITLIVSTTVGRATASAGVAVRINRHARDPYQILHWHWR